MKKVDYFFYESRPCKYIDGDFFYELMTTVSIDGHAFSFWSRAWSEPLSRHYHKLMNEGGLLTSKEVLEELIKRKSFSRAKGFFNEEIGPSL